MFEIHIEQIRQARSIHGGWIPMAVACLGIQCSRIPIPKFLRQRTYAMMFGSKYPALAESELEKPLTEYRSLNELFTRGVPIHHRPLPTNQNQWLVPADGTVQEVGVIGANTELLVKGQRYLLSSLCPMTDTSPYTDGMFAVFFLSPRDCHRVFAPAHCELTRLIHIPGHRLLVHPTHQREKYPVFSLNERQVMEFRTELGRCLVVMVAGWGVGNISHPFSVQRRFSGRRVTVNDLNEPRKIQRGEWMATFELGSTVILVVENKPGLESLVSSEQVVQFHQPVFEINPPHPGVQYSHA
ncbi:MAG: phosphatidylserine decarboxylase [Planctomyces sp.]|nr:phosphatidylserine decarboxylase [Planctomyces sp.]